MPAISEFDIQRAFVLWYGGDFKNGNWNILPSVLPGVEWWHTPNGGERRDAFEGKRLKQMGVKPGIPDLWFLWGRLYGLEFKKPGGVLSTAQRSLHPRLTAAGALIATVDNLDAAKAQVKAWGLTSIC